MEYRQFGETDIKVSAIGFGCWEIGGTYGRIDEIQFQRAVGQAIDNGINCFDTAEAYDMGVSEQALAWALRGRRQDICIVTKFRVGFDEMPNRRDSSRARVLASIEKSLKRLQTDHVDVYLGALGWAISGPDIAEIDAILARHGCVTEPPGWLED
jgi:aryl-alcohol dehydrogenase-like predicted oxidoreductase